MSVKKMSVKKKEVKKKEVKKNPPVNLNIMLRKCYIFKFFERKYNKFLAGLRKNR